MEILLLLFLFSTLDKNGDMKDMMRSFLSFYRENRELIAMLANAKTSPAPEPEGEKEEKKSRPVQSERSGAENIPSSILEEFLKKNAV